MNSIAFRPSGNQDKKGKILLILGSSTVSSVYIGPAVLHITHEHIFIHASREASTSSYKWDEQRNINNSK